MFTFLFGGSGAPANLIKVDACEIQKLE